MIKTALTLCCLSWLLSGFAQQDTVKQRWLWFSIYIPGGSYHTQHAPQVQIPENATFLWLNKKVRAFEFEALKARCIIKERFSIGVKVALVTKVNADDFQSNLENNNNTYHILNLIDEGFSNFNTGFIVGYRQPFLRSEKKCHYVGVNLHLNFDNIDYGFYTYEAKSVTNNSFYNYGFYTNTSNRKSWTIELEKSTAYSLKTWRNKLLLGIKFGVTPRHQTIGFAETIRDFNGTTSTILPAATFRSITYNLGLFLAIEGPFLKN